nr:hypothetical protein BgiMline_000603 [Biomphalaria glabrata]
MFWGGVDKRCIDKVANINFSLVCCCSSTDTPSKATTDESKFKMFSLHLLHQQRAGLVHVSALPINNLSGPASQQPHSYISAEPYELQLL